MSFVESGLGGNGVRSFLWCAAVLLAGVSFLAAQNPDTTCTTRQVLPGALVCENPCDEGCGWNEEVIEGWMWVQCNCDDTYSSTCCNLRIGFNAVPRYRHRAVGSCAPGLCGPGGACVLQSSGGEVVTVCKQVIEGTDPPEVCGPGGCGVVTGTAER